MDPQLSLQSNTSQLSVDSLMRALARLPSPQRSARERALALHELYSESFRRATRGRFELRELLGAGGMGIVYAARNLRTEREVAIKFLLPCASGPSAQPERAARFVREARAAGRIRHPNVVDVYDLETDAEVPHLIMERLHGESLRSRLERGPLPVDEAVSVMRAAMAGVIEAHRQGVIHRDLKPDNIFIAKSAGSGEPAIKVLDFGVSRIFAGDDQGTCASTITGAGHVLGTPAYMPLEQLRGDQSVDGRIDVYALGVMLYEALSGMRPYVARNHNDLLVRMATEPPVPLHAHLPTISPAVSRLVMRALARDRAQRPSGVKEFAMALDELQHRARARPLLRPRWTLLLAVYPLSLATFALPPSLPTYGTSSVQDLAPRHAESPAIPSALPPVPRCARDDCSVRTPGPRALAGRPREAHLRGELDQGPDAF